MTGSSPPKLSICIPTYNNADNLHDVLTHALSFESDDVEFVVGNDGSVDATDEVVQGFDDDRLLYYENESNLGFEPNLLKVIEQSNGEYVLPMADEDLLIHDTTRWILDTITESESGFGCLIGSYGDESEWNNSNWDDVVGDEEWFDPGRESLCGFLDIPHPYAEHTWRRNYLGGFVLNRDRIDLNRAEDFYGCIYLHDVLILQSLVSDCLVLTSRDICNYHYYEYDVDENEHRYWGNSWSEIERRVRMQKYRIKLIDEMISDPVARERFLKKEQHFAANVAAWAIYSNEHSFSEIRALALNEDVYEVSSVWASLDFWRLTLRYLAVLPLPFSRLKTNLSSGYLGKDALTVWNQVAKRALPDSVYTRLKKRIAPVVTRS
ncbi:glycosyltransferase family 2 protein [Halorientalis pallida]|uniref:glycosyltransferase family 2 protein n=1 Tax=Halorientalis pallida TaxID=2479928 RepID=UPI003C6F0E70